METNMDITQEDIDVVEEVVERNDNLTNVKSRIKRWIHQNDIGIVMAIIIGLITQLFVYK